VPDVGENGAVNFVSYGDDQGVCLSARTKGGGGGGKRGGGKKGQGRSFIKGELDRGGIAGRYGRGQNRTRLGSIKRKKEKTGDRHENGPHPMAVRDPELDETEEDEDKAGEEERKRNRAGKAGRTPQAM